MNDKIKSIKEQLNHLNKDELKDIKLYTLFLLSKPTESNGLEREEKVQLLKILNRSCNSIIKWPESPELLAYTNKPLFHNVYIELQEFIEKYCKTIKRVQRDGLIEKLMTLKFRAIEKKFNYADIPLNQKSFLKDSTSLTAIVDNAFPGYLQSGLISVLYPKMIRHYNG